MRESRRAAKIVFLIAFLWLASTRLVFPGLPDSLVKNFKWRNIGPANSNGRVSDIEALGSDFTHVLVASASGGVFKSTNAGTTWAPIFDHYGSASIGDIALCQSNPDIIWVGTGEKNCRNSVSWGDGIYKSIDGGKTFTNMGLADTQCIARIVIHPQNPDIVYAAAAGHLWGYSGDRGLFKTIDGGKTWQKLVNGLPDDGKTGAIDIVMDPLDPAILYVAFWQRLRQPHRFASGGPNGGIFKSTDNGLSFSKLTNGLPAGDTGKIGLAISAGRPNVLMAIVEHGFQPPERLSDGLVNPGYIDRSKPGSGIYRSEDSGQTWTFMNRRNIRPFYYSHIYMHPANDQEVYVLDVDFMVSPDKGRTFKKLFSNAYSRGYFPQGLHGDSHALWFDPLNPKRFYIGDDGGIALTHDHIHFIFFDNFCISQFYAITADMKEPYSVYGGLQDHATWAGPSRTRDNYILTDHWFKVPGGDGFYVQVDPKGPGTLYFESQEGEICRMNLETRETDYIKPGKENVLNYSQYATDAVLKEQQKKGWGQTPFRFNWSSPILLSPHNPSVVYLGGNHLFKSLDKGDRWQVISPDLSVDDPVKTSRETGGLTRDVSGAENYGTIVAISESPLVPGILWVGTDDGNVQLSQDGGANWKNVRARVPGVPDGLWVSRLEASHFDAQAAYLTFDGHRSDDFRPWVFKTIDSGQHFIDIGRGIPSNQPVYVIREDGKNPNLLFAGTEFGVYYSLDGGLSWANLSLNLPTVAVHDLYIHPRDGDLIAGTHGRGIWIVDDISPLQQINRTIREKDAHLFSPRPVCQWKKMGRGGSRGHFYFRGLNPPDEALIHYYLAKSPQKKVEILISDITGSLTFKTTCKGEPGINRWAWDMVFDPTPGQCREFTAQVIQYIKTMSARIQPDMRPKLKSLQEQLQKAGNDAMRLVELKQEIIATIGRTERKPGDYRAFRGPRAEPGEYKVTLTVDGKSQVTSLAIRPDPMTLDR